MADITAIILTKNEEKNLPDCLKSIRGFCARAVVVDCGSTDDTVKIAREMGADVLLPRIRNTTPGSSTGPWTTAKSKPPGPSGWTRTSGSPRSWLRECETLMARGGRVRHHRWRPPITSWAEAIRHGLRKQAQADAVPAPESGAHRGSPPGRPHGALRAETACWRKTPVHPLWISRISPVMSATGITGTPLGKCWTIFPLPQCTHVHRSIATDCAILRHAEEEVRPVLQSYPCSWRG